jgi:pyruvate kinase
LQQDDLRPLQSPPAPFGLSSLGRCAAHVDATLAEIATAAAALSGKPHPANTDTSGQAVRVADGGLLRRARTEQLLGPEPAHRPTRIMVTLPGDAATDRHLVEDLLADGMNLARINCAHDDRATWAAMIANVRRAATATGMSCRVAMDLAGPKLRTGPLVDGPGVVKPRPRKNAYGRVTSPAGCLLAAADRSAAAPESGPPVIPVDAGRLERLRPADHVHLRDTPRRAADHDRDRGVRREQRRHRRAVVRPVRRRCRGPVDHAGRAG